MGVPVTTVDPSLPTVTAPPSPASKAFSPESSFEDELDRQITSYVQLGVPPTEPDRTRSSA